MTVIRENAEQKAREEAEAMIRANEGEMCVRLYKRTDGTVLTADCRVGVRARRIKMFRRAAIAGTSVRRRCSAASASRSR